MRKLGVMTIAVAVLLACVAANALCSGGQSEVGIDMAKKSPIGFAPHGEADAPSENPSDENLVLASTRTENQPSENLVLASRWVGNQPSENLVRAETVGVIASSHSPESPHVNVQPAIDIPPEVPPELVIPPGMEIRDGYWVSTVEPELLSARDALPADLGNLHRAETVSAEQASKLENVRLARAENEEKA